MRISICKCITTNIRYIVIFVPLDVTHHIDLDSGGWMWLTHFHLRSILYTIYDTLYNLLHWRLPVYPFISSLYISSLYKYLKGSRCIVCGVGSLLLILSNLSWDAESGASRSSRRSLSHSPCHSPCTPYSVPRWPHSGSHSPRLPLSGSSSFPAPALSPSPSLLT